MGRRRVAGFTYLTALFMIAIMSAGLALVGEMWETTARREREAELLYVGNQYRLAIQRYYLSGPQQYPRTFQDLLKDPRIPAPRRHLRQLYRDPVTGSNEWAIVKGPDGGIMGVYSKSEEAPLKVTNFRLRDRDFENAKKYADWKFVFVPTALGQQQRPGAPAPDAPAPGIPGAPAPALPGATPSPTPLPGAMPSPTPVPGGASPTPFPAPPPGASAIPAPPPASR
jgi:type II secretory pathway pseudopilin PulG